jgi:hypothetical protein
MKKLILLMVAVIVANALCKAGYFGQYKTSSNGSGNFDNYSIPTPDSYNVGGVKANFHLSTDVYITSIAGGTESKAKIYCESQYKIGAVCESVAIKPNLMYGNQSLWPEGWEPVWGIAWRIKVNSVQGTTAYATLSAWW